MIQLAINMSGLSERPTTRISKSSCFSSRLREKNKKTNNLISTLYLNTPCGQDATGTWFSEAEGVCQKNVVLFYFCFLFFLNQLLRSHCVSLSFTEFLSILDGKKSRLNSRNKQTNKYTNIGDF